MTADCLSQELVIQCAVMLSNESVHCDVVDESVVKLMKRADASTSVSFTLIILKRSGISDVRKYLSLGSV